MLIHLGDLYYVTLYYVYYVLLISQLEHVVAFINKTKATTLNM